MGFAVKAVKGIFGGGKKQEAPAAQNAATTSSPTGPKVTALSDPSAYDPRRKKRAPQFAGQTLLSDTLG